jgi:hypothetical protein
MSEPIFVYGPTANSQIILSLSALPANQQTPEVTMRRRQALKFFAGLALCPLCAPNSFSAKTHHWTYDGETGPDKWGSLDVPSAARAYWSSV